MYPVSQNRHPKFIDAHINERDSTLFVLDNHKNVWNILRIVTCRYKNGEYRMWQATGTLSNVRHNYRKKIDNHKNVWNSHQSDRGM